MRLEEQSAKLSCGSAVYHPHHGIGKVQSVRDRNFDSGNDTKYTELYFQREALTLILPIQDAREMVRNPINRAQARQILEHTERWDRRPTSQGKARAAPTPDARDRGDPFEYAEDFKGLSRLEAESK